MKNVFFLMIFILSFPFVFSSFNASFYEDKAEIQVLCDEYRGYVSINLPIYANYYSINETLYIEREQNTYVKIPNWYLTSFEDLSITDSEKIFDSSFTSYASKQGDSLTLAFTNPLVQNVDRISIDTIDSQVSNVVIKGLNRSEYQVQTQGFHTDIFLSTSVSSIEMTIVFDSIIKIRDMSFYEYKMSNSTTGYFFVDNNCNVTRTIYMGNYGSSNVLSGKQNVAMFFSSDIQLSNNELYSSDLDLDGIENTIDNCPFVSNPTQDDIDFSSVGDACEDWDNDRVLNYVDNCVDTYNPDQKDSDNDGTGDVCDTNDNRFFESNKDIVYILSAIIVGLFVALTFSILKNTSKKKL